MAHRCQQCHAPYPTFRVEVGCASCDWKIGDDVFVPEPLPDPPPDKGREVMYYHLDGPRIAEPTWFEASSEEDAKASYCKHTGWWDRSKIRVVGQSPEQPLVYLARVGKGAVVWHRAGVPTTTV